MVLEACTLQVMATKIKFHSRYSWICHAFRQVGNLIFIDFHSWSKKMGLILGHLHILVFEFNKNLDKHRC